MEQDLCCPACPPRSEDIFIEHLTDRLRRNFVQTSFYSSGQRADRQTFRFCSLLRKVLLSLDRLLASLGAPPVRQQFRPCRLWVQVRGGGGRRRGGNGAGGFSSCQRWEMQRDQVGVNGPFDARHPPRAVLLYTTARIASSSLLPCKLNRSNSLFHPRRGEDRDVFRPSKKGGAVPTPSRHNLWSLLKAKNFNSHALSKRELGALRTSGERCIRTGVGVFAARVQPESEEARKAPGLPLLCQGYGAPASCHQHNLAWYTICGL